MTRGELEPNDYWCACGDWRVQKPGGTCPSCGGDGK